MSQSDSDNENVDPLDGDSLNNQPQDNSEDTTGPFGGEPLEDMNALLSGLDTPQAAENTQQGLEAFAAKISDTPEQDESTAVRILNMDTDSVDEPEDTLAVLGRLEEAANQEEAAEAASDGSAPAAGNESPFGEEIPSSSGQEDLFGGPDAFEQPTPFEGTAPFEGTDTDGFTAVAETAAEGGTERPEPSKKTKKAPKKTKPKKERKPAAPSIFSSPITWICLLIWVGGNIWGTMAKGIDKPFFWICFNVLGVILFSVPVLLRNVRKREGGVSLYNAALALALGLIVIGCMLLVIAQAPYGFKIKP
ncbi:MAG: hypothetical protein J6S75_14615 [Thermoguttaceae bacterium]|nr:hypothetical protein [Thermoguttaceae bacterium]